MAGILRISKECVVSVVLLMIFTTQVYSETAAQKVRLGYFANLTHAQALIGVGRGDFQKALGSAKLETTVFNAGPSVIEAMFANQLDCSFIGPSPAINGFVKSKGKAFKIVCGAAANGVVIVARKESGVTSLKDLAGRRIATPQFGNTQDIAARAYVRDILKQKIGEGKGETRVIPIANAEQLQIFKRGDIDASWVPEPWGARLVNDAGGVIIAEEKDLWPGKMFATTILIVSTSFLEKHPDLVLALVRSHSEITAWINTNRSEAAAIVNQQLQAISGKALATTVLGEAFGRVVFTTDALFGSIEKSARQSFDAGLLKEVPHLAGLIDSSFIQTVAKEKSK